MTTKTIEIQFPYPPSVNRAYRVFNGRILKSKAFRDYSRTISHEVLCHGQFEDIRNLSNKRLKVEIWAYPPDRRKRDLDNLGKVLLDSLQTAGVFLDDSQIDDLRFRRGEVTKPGYVVVNIANMIGGQND